MFMALLCVALPAPLAHAQPYLTQSYAIEEGLIQSQASALYQDRDGYLWIGTFGGLSRFDGLNFTNYTMDEGLTSNRITALAEDKEGNLWVGSINGITVKKDSSYKHLTTSNGLLDNAINNLLVAPDGTVWIASQSGLSRYDGTTFRHFTEADGLASSVVISVKADLNGDIWAATEEGLCQIQGKEISCYTTEDGIPYHVVTDVLIDSKKRIWAATPRGLAMRSTDGSNQFLPRSDLPFMSITAILEDSHGAIWLGTKRGVARLDESGKLTHSWRDGNWIVIPLLEDSEHNVWAGTSGRGIVKFQQTAFTHMNPEFSLPQDVYLGVYEDRNQVYWFGTMINGMYKISPEGVDHFDPITYPNLQHVRSFAEDDEGNLWIGTSNGAERYDGATFKHYGREEGLTNTYVFGIQPDHQGRVWIGTMDGLSVLEDDSLRTIDLNAGADRKIVFTVQEGQDDRIWIGSVLGLMYYENDQLHKVSVIHKRPVTSILADNSGDLWLGTLGFGVLRYRPQTGEVVDSLNTSHGLNSSTVYFTKFDGLGDLWIGTSKGVNHVDMEMYRMESAKTIRAFGKADGILGIETNTNAATTDHKGRLWFGTIDALMHYDTSARPINTTPPPIHITGVRLFLDEINPEDYQKEAADLASAITFAYDKNHLTFDFLGLSYTAPEMVRYQYRLSGFDHDWQPAFNSRYATYSNLPAGNYTFEVSAINNDGTLSEKPASLSFIVTPPFWETSWFITLSVLSSLLGIAGLVQLRTRSLNHRRIELEETVAERTEDLRKTHHELLEAREAALQAAKSKSAFMSAMTHELRTPMNGILGMTQILTITNMDEEQLDCAETIMECSTMMMDLIENLLTFADLAAGQRTLSIERFKLPELLDETISAIRSKGLAKELETRYFLSPAVPLEIEADREHTRQILNHLLSNAIKFTQAGVVFVEVQLERQAQKDNPNPNLLFSVHDTGIGMEDHQLKRVFEAFSQGDMSISRQFQGTGIGLALVQQLTMLLEGKLGAKSWPGIGSSFYFSLPLATDHVPALLTDGDPSPLSGKKVLLTIDDARERRRLALLCKSFGMVIIESKAQANGMDMVISDPPKAGDTPFYKDAALVVLDDLDAYESAGAILRPETSGEEVEQVLLSAAGIHVVG